MMPKSPHIEGGPDYVPIANYITFLVTLFVLSITGMFIFYITTNPSMWIKTTVLSAGLAFITAIYHSHMVDIHSKYSIGIGTPIIIITTIIGILSTMPTWAVYIWAIIFSYGVGLLIGSATIFAKENKNQITLN